MVDTGKLITHYLQIALTKAGAPITPDMADELEAIDEAFRDLDRRISRIERNVSFRNEAV